MRKPINPVAKAMAQNRRRAQVVAPKRGKGSYNRKKVTESQNMEKEYGKGMGRNRNVSED